MLNFENDRRSREVRIGALVVPAVYLRIVATIAVFVVLGLLIGLVA